MESEIIKVVESYIRSIHTQDFDDFDKVWAKEHDCTLISITNEFRGRENVFNDFYTLLGRKFTSIDLVNDGIEVNMVNNSLAVVLFRYHTECIIRDTNEPYGIRGLETQVIIKENDAWKLLHVHYSK